MGRAVVYSLVTVSSLVVFAWWAGPRHPWAGPVVFHISHNHGVHAGDLLGLWLPAVALVAAWRSAIAVWTWSTVLTPPLRGSRWR